MQPVAYRKGFALFVRCCELSSKTSLDEYLFVINTLDGILLALIGGRKEDFFPHPNGGAIYLSEVGDALEAARALAGGLGAAGISAGLGMAWGDFRRTLSVQDWNAAARPLNEAARLAYWACRDKDAGHVLATPHVGDLARSLAEFGKQDACEVKGSRYCFQPVRSAEYRLLVAARGSVPAPAESSRDSIIVLWDIKKYSAERPDAQARLSTVLAELATTALDMYGVPAENFSPTGDGGFALFGKDYQAIQFARQLGRYAADNGITIRIGINHGMVAFAGRGPVGPGVLRTDDISALAPENGVAILADVWEQLDGTLRKEWQATQMPPDLFALLPNPGLVRTPPGPLSAADRAILVAALRDSPDFQTVRQRQAFVRTTLEKYPAGKEVYNTLGLLDFEGGRELVAHELVLRLEPQEVAPGLPALRVVAEELPGGEDLADLRRRRGWGAG